MTASPEARIIPRIEENCTSVQMVYHGPGQVIARSVRGVDDGVGYGAGFGVSGKKGNGLDEAI